MALNKPPLHTDEQEARLLQTPRKKPLPVPLVGVFDEPSVLIKVNREWWSHVSGMIDVLSALDAWVGDDDEKTRGIREIAALLSTDWSAMFVEDVRFDVDEMMLQQRKNGVYEDIIDWEFFINYVFDIEDDVMLIEARVDNNEIDILDLQDVTNALDTRLGDVETLQATHDTSIANLATRMDTAEDDIDALDARLTALEASDSTMWSVHYNFKTGEHGFGGGSGVTWTSGVGYSWSTSPIIIAKTDSSFLDGRIAFYRLELSKGGAGEQDYTVKIVDDLYSYGVAESGLNIRYHKLQSLSTRQDLEIQFAAAGSWILEGLTIFGYGDSNAYDD